METQLAESNLWQELKTALASSRSAGLHHLRDLLGWVILSYSNRSSLIPQAKRTHFAREGSEQILDLYSLRFQVLMADWEETDDPLELSCLF